MRLKTQMLKTTVTSLLAFMFIVLIVLVPRDLNLSLDSNLWVTNYSFDLGEYVTYIRDFFAAAIQNGTLGETRYIGQSSEAAAFGAVGKSLLVIVSALILGFVFGILKGVLDYKLSKTKFSVLGHWTTWLFQSVPDFFLMLIAQWVLIKHVPAVRYFAVDGWEAFVLPSLLVSIYPIFFIARITSASLLAQEGKMYILLAKAKGLSDRKIVYKHMLRNGVASILTHLPGLLVFILSNLLVVEYYRNYPGAAWRLFLALDFNTFSGTGGNYEPGVIIYIAFSFMVLFMIVQWISQSARKYFDPRSEMR
ncbi:ABC transporter permease [Paenibacillus sp. LC231]|uniref:ABC transporter permease subunit n=1 Tax=unclassified Paenibacillus TaxID=185978 RepID=UPI0008DC852F|nr:MULTISPECIES: ABC transporter permease subunit [unclassified Paenibacillus]MCT1398339.1 ABC transporter permease subunit [Paenibacillus sp. p3-SID867]OIB04055.1 ABC transporter permease [Paenibacillus sp. LC231]